MGANLDQECTPEKIELKTCLASSHFISRMMGYCDDLKKKYEACMQIEVIAFNNRLIE
jgi:hypothetical protein